MAPGRAGPAAVLVAAAVLAAVAVRAGTHSAGPGPLAGAGLGLYSGYRAARSTWAGVYFGAPTLLAFLLPLLWAVPRRVDGGGVAWLIPSVGAAWAELLLPGALALALVSLERRLERRKYRRPFATPDGLAPLVTAGRMDLARTYLEKALSLDPAALGAARIAGLDPELFPPLATEDGRRIPAGAAWELPDRHGGWVLVEFGPGEWAVLGEEDELRMVETGKALPFFHLVRESPDGTCRQMGQHAPDYGMDEDARSDRELARRTREELRRFAEAAAERAGCRRRRMAKERFDEEAFRRAWAEAAGPGAPPAADAPVPSRLDGRSLRSAYLSSPRAARPEELARELAEERGAGAA